jgi:hypothetical protein
VRGRASREGRQRIAAATRPSAQSERINVADARQKREVPALVDVAMALPN